jgi:SAM-dependent methyltransferase
MNSTSTGFEPAAYWEERLRKHPGITGVGYTSLGKYFNQWQYRVRKHVFRRLIRSLHADWQNAAVLDVGSGTGFYVDLWKDLGVKSLTGSDLTQTAISRLKREFPDVGFVHLDIGDSQVQLRSDRFDAVSALDILFHIVDDSRYRQALANIGSVLRPRGVFIFSDVLLHGPTQRSVHMVSRSILEVERYLGEANFEIIRRVPLFVLMNHPIDTRSRVRAFLWRLFVYIIRKSEILGQVFGAILYPLELILTATLNESASTEILVCRKREGLRDCK